MQTLFKHYSSLFYFILLLGGSVKVRILGPAFRLAFINFLQGNKSTFGCDKRFSKTIVCADNYTVKTIVQYFWMWMSAFPVNPSTVNDIPYFWCQLERINLFFTFQHRIRCHLTLSNYWRESLMNWGEEMVGDSLPH